MQKEIVLTNEPPVKFSFGRILATPNALNRIPNDEMLTALSRHVRGDWGELDAGGSFGLP